MIAIKEKLLALYTKRLVKTNQTIRFNVGYEQAQLIGLLYTHESSQKNKAILQFVKKVAATGKQVHTLCYIPTKSDVYDGGFPAFTQRDISLFIESKNKQVRDFLNTPFDYLYYLDLAHHPVVDYLLAKCNAKCRVGKFDVMKADLFEVMIKLETQANSYELNRWIEIILHYTQLLKA